MVKTFHSQVLIDKLTSKLKGEAEVRLFEEIFYLIFPLYLISLSKFDLSKITVFFIIFLIHQINYKIYLPKFKNIFFFIVVIGPWGINKAFPILTIIKKLFYKQIMF